MYLETYYVMHQTYQRIKDDQCVRDCQRAPRQVNKQ